MAIPFIVVWKLVRLHLHNRRQPPLSKPWKPVSGDGKSHLTHFCNRSIITMQTAGMVIDGMLDPTMRVLVKDLHVSG